MKRFVVALLCMCMIISSLTINAVATNASYYSEKGLIECKSSSYKDGNYYTGTKITNPHLDVKSFGEFQITSAGGTHVDGDGKAVFSNYITFNILLNYSKNTKKIAGTDAYVSKDSCDWNDMNKKNGYKYGDADTDTEKQRSYGAILVTRRDADGNVYKFPPIFSTGNTSLEQQYLNVDGDYTIYLFFETVKNGKYQNHILSWSFKIRTSVYLLDKTSGLHIKNSKLSGNDVIIDTASRNGATVQVYKDGKFYQSCYNGSIISESGKYKFVVENAGFVCEVFTFTIDKTNIDKKIFFYNLRRQLGSNSYEAEGYFKFEWDASALNPIQYATYSFCNGVGKDLYNLSEEKYSTPILYTPGTVLDEVGTYLIYAFDGKQSVTYYVNVVDMDKPSQNYEKLSSKRFNTFKTKWWEVYDDINERYLCFDYDTEYDRAYEAAMTIANNSVISGTGRYYFNDRWYSDRIELTSAMNEYVFENNLSLVYYDPMNYSDDESSERTFSSEAFDDSIYLDDAFQFVTSHPSEVEIVIAIDEYGVEHTIEFFTPISQQPELSDGQYLIKEFDKYGNETSYTAVRDKSAPELLMSFSNELCEAEDGMHYITSEFSVVTLFDKYDEYSVLKVSFEGENYYYYKSEYQNASFEKIGEYSVSAYDRNGNIIQFTVTVQ